MHICYICGFFSSSRISASMALFTPTNQKRLTNITIVRLKKGGERYEIACYPNKVRSWRDRIENKLDEVLQSQAIFANVSKGKLANKKEMYEAFGTEDESKIAVYILENGDLQVTEKERSVENQNLFRDVAKFVSERCLNTETGRGYPVTMIEKMMKDCHINLKSNKSAKQQGLEVIKELRANAGFKIAPALLEIVLTIDKDYFNEVRDSILELIDQVIRTDSFDGSCELVRITKMYLRS
ncbi:unnamed protein product [Protopolystoma xenopodis]|uniref:Ribosome maturation protein SBDS n=1 Tax=Protopolystoma xenopodis TaxID=117903 RepID=A0A448X1U4_9PLAT|nr:unnamed protein product [Protopolystoma xenopodis]